MQIYHITSRQEFEHARQIGSYVTGSLATEGFIHTSTYQQVIGTANLLFRGQVDLILLVIDTEKLASELKFDPVGTHGDIQEFPHIYGPINLDAVIDVVDFPPEDDGSFVIPGKLS